MYNKSEIMKRAWSLYRTGDYRKFADTLRQAWSEAKHTAEMRAQGYVNATELSVGDTIAVNGYGGYEGNNFTAVVAEIKPYKIGGCKKDFIVISCGTDEICMEASEMVKRVATVAAVEYKAA